MDGIFDQLGSIFVHEQTCWIWNYSTKARKYHAPSVRRGLPGCSEFAQKDHLQVYVSKESRMREACILEDAFSPIRSKTVCQSILQLQSSAYPAVHTITMAVSGERCDCRSTSAAMRGAVIYSSASRERFYIRWLRTANTKVVCVACFLFLLGLSETSSAWNAHVDDISQSLSPLVPSCVIIRLTVNLRVWPGVVWCVLHPGKVA